MRLPPGRFPGRRMMVAVAAVAVLFGTAAGLRRRRESFERQAGEYAKKSREELMAGMLADHRYASIPELRMRDEHYRLMDYFDGMKRKYERAAARPWLAIEADRPPPAWPDGVPRVDEFMRPRVRDRDSGEVSVK